MLDFILEKSKIYQYYKKDRVKFFAIFTFFYNILFGVGKIIFGLLTKSVYLLIYSLYNIGLGIAKGINLIPNHAERDAIDYLICSFIVIGSSLAYVIYSVYAFYYVTPRIYRYVVAIGIAVFAFSDISISIFGIVKARRLKNLPNEALKFTSLVSSLVALSLTQSAVVSAKLTNLDAINYISFIGSMFFGSIALLVGLYMLIRIKTYRDVSLNKNYYGNLCTKFYKLKKPYISKEELDFYYNYFQEDYFILNVFAGIGRYLNFPKVEKYDITALDLSKHMLAELENNYSHINTICDDVCYFKSSKKYDLIYAGSGCFSLLINNRQINRALINLYNHLNPGGKLILSVDTINKKIIINPNAYKIKDEFDKENDSKILLKSKTSVQNNILSNDIIFEYYRKNKIKRRELMYYTEKLYEDNEFDGYLAKIGFKNINKINSFDGKTKLTDLIIYVCEK